MIPIDHNPRVMVSSGKDCILIEQVITGYNVVKIDRRDVPLLISALQEITDDKEWYKHLT
jgi:hypothetical protein